MICWLTTLLLVFYLLIVYKSLEFGSCGRHCGGCIASRSCSAALEVVLFERLGGIRGCWDSGWCRARPLMGAAVLAPPSASVCEHMHTLALRSDVHFAYSEYVCALLCVPV